MKKKAKKPKQSNNIIETDDKKKLKNKQSNVNFFKRIFIYLKELKGELRRVSWPTRKSLFNGAFTVFTMVAIVSTIVIVADLIFRQLLRALFLVV